MVGELVESVVVDIVLALLELVPDETEAAVVGAVRAVDVVAFNMACFCMYMKPSMAVLLKKQNHGRSPGSATWLRRDHSAAHPDCWV